MAEESTTGLVFDDTVVTHVPKYVDDATFEMPPELMVASASTITRMEQAAAGKATPDDPRYVVHNEVGRGGMGRVLQVRDQDLNRHVAMKVLLTDKQTVGHRRRFIEEAQIHGQLQHPNVPPVHDFGVNAQGEMFFTMQYVRDHRTLKDIIDGLRQGDKDLHRRFSIDCRAQIAQQLCNALAYAHDHGVVHRDIKPSNILIGNCGEVFIADWGIAKIVSEGGDVQTSTAPTQAPSDAIFGTLAYMSPEQVLGHDNEVDAKSDVYSLCAVLYEFFSLHHYLGGFKGKAPVQCRDLILSGRRRKAESFKHPIQGRVSRHLSRMCERGVQPDKQKRFVNANQLYWQLQAYLEGNGPIVCPGTAVKRGLSRWGKLIDLYPVIAPLVTYTSVAIAVASVGYCAYLLGTGQL